eukprot:843444-Rhodomonas_salina.1
MEKKVAFPPSPGALFAPLSADIGSVRCQAAREAELSDWKVADLKVASCPIRMRAPVLTSRVLLPGAVQGKRTQGSIPPLVLRVRFA